MEDEEIGFISKKKGQGVTRSSPSIKYYGSIWNSFEVRGELLFRRWESASGAPISWLMMVPRGKIPEMLRKQHNSPAAGHFGVNKTLAKVRQQFYWATRRQDAEDWHRRCDTCTVKKEP